MKRSEVFLKVYGYLVAIQAVSTRRELAEIIGVHESTISLAYKGVESALTNNLMDAICAKWPDVLIRDNVLEGKEPFFTYEGMVAHFKIKERKATPEEVSIIDLASKLIKDVESIRADAKEMQTELLKELNQARELNTTLGIRIGMLDRILSNLSSTSMVAEDKNV